MNPISSALYNEIANKVDIKKENWVPVKITNIKVADVYSILSTPTSAPQDYENISVAVYQTFESPKDAHKHNENKSLGGSVFYNPRYQIEIQTCDDTHTSYYLTGEEIHRRWLPSERIPHLLVDRYGKFPDFPIPVVLSTDTGSIYINGTEQIHEISQLIRTIEPTIDNNKPYNYSEDIKKYERFLRFKKQIYNTFNTDEMVDNSDITTWVQTEIKSVMVPDKDELSVAVDTPTGTAIFNFETKETQVAQRFVDLNRNTHREYVNAKLQEIHGEDFEFAGTPVYIRLDRDRFYDDITLYHSKQCHCLDGIDSNSEWQISLEDPRNCDCL